MSAFNLDWISIEHRCYEGAKNKNGQQEFRKPEFAKYFGRAPRKKYASDQRDKVRYGYLVEARNHIKLDFCRRREQQEPAEDRPYRRSSKR